MTKQEAKEKGYTNLGTLYDVPIYFTQDEEMNVVGTNWLNELLIKFFIWFDLNFTNNEGFAIKDKGKL